jgi:uncharacterized 2Fe-2S/4Fe-4S cluster protein (DUF4445 family)
MTGEGTSPRCHVSFQPVGCRVEVAAGTSVLAAAQEAGVELVALCGGQGSCQSCRVRLARGALSAPTPAEQDVFSREELAAGFRLACHARVQSDVTIDIPPESLTTPQRLQIEGLETGITLDPVVVARDVEMTPPSLEDLRADSVRVCEALQTEGQATALFPLPVLTELSNQLREQKWHVRLAMRGREVVALLPHGERLMGLAVDIGTTKLAAYLVDLDSGVTVAKTGTMNPQIGFGEDVISRIVHADRGRQQQAELQERVVATLNAMLADLCTEIGERPEQVVEAVIVGNTAMHHLFLGLPTRQLASSPYVPAVSEPMDVRAEAIGLRMAPGAYIHLPPNIAGYVGGDHVAMLLATEVWKAEKTTMALDIGTNTEISLASEGQLFSCSCASGPAFEGAHIRDGMRAAGGAIERVQIQDGDVRVQTIGGQRPVGICGSGILDAIAAMVSVGALNGSGRLQTEHPLVRTSDDGKRECVLVAGGGTGHGRDIAITQKDVHEFQLAKAAIRVGIDTLLDEAGLTPASLEEFIVAGAFGTYIDVASAIGVRMFPALPLERFRQVGNAAGAGAKQMLISGKARRISASMGERVEYVELARHPRFSQGFMEALYLQRTSRHG